MKCWLSRTSAIAASISSLIELYCALRSSSGTFIMRALFQLSVKLLADSQPSGQRDFFVEIEAAKNTRLNFFVAVSGFRAMHHSVGVRRAEPVSVPTHPADLTRRISYDQRKVCNTPSHYRTSADKSIPSNGHSAYNRGIGADR